MPMPSNKAVDSHVSEHDLQTSNVVNPFYHRVNSSLYQNLKVVIFFVPAIIFRLIPMLGCLFMSWVFATIGTIGMNRDQIQSKPLTQWRKIVRWIFSRVWMRGIFFFAGFYMVKIKGQRASRKEAPILVVGPHSSLVDVLPLVLLGSPSVVCKASMGEVPIFRTLIDFTQPIYVSREDASSRVNAIHAIENRSKSSKDLPQVYIYPEGTTTNRSTLIHFKVGAFSPGVPVQPLIIKYPNWNDTITWTFDGISMFEVFSRSLTQFYSKCEIEFLPVYFPNEAEKNDPNLYARNVRYYMARKLSTPFTNYRITDGLIIEKMVETKPVLISKLRRLDEYRDKLRISFEMELNIFNKIETERESVKFTMNEFRKNFQVEENIILIEQIFQLFDPTQTGEIDIREYLICAFVLNSTVETKTIVQVMFKMYSEGPVVSLSTFRQILQRIYGKSRENTEKYIKFDYSAMNEDEFYSEMFKCLEYLKLCALESKGMISMYPSRDFELN